MGPHGTPRHTHFVGFVAMHVVGVLGGIHVRKLCPELGVIYIKIFTALLLPCTGNREATHELGAVGGCRGTGPNHATETAVLCRIRLCWILPPHFAT